MSIIVKTRIGAGGKWINEGTWNTGPKNLLAAVRCASEALEETRGVGGYHTAILVDDVPIGTVHGMEWPTTMDDARKIIARCQA